jgi:hypothetical protein
MGRTGGTMLVKEVLKLQIGQDEQSREWRMTLLRDGKSRVLISAPSESSLVDIILAKFDTERSQ